MSTGQARKRRGSSGGQSESRGFRSWATAALGALVLVVGGFLLGVALGVVSEEPDIVARHMVGQSEEVTWNDSAPAEVSAPPASVPTTRLAEAEPERRPQAAQPVERVEQVEQVEQVERAEDSTAWVIQVGAFSRSNSADALAASLKAKGFRAYLQPSAGASEERWRVRVGPLASEGEAQRMARRLEREESLSTWVLSEGGG